MNVLDKKLSNGQTYESRLLQLGAGAGRQYPTPDTEQSGERFSRLRHQLHEDNHVADCRVCNALHESGSPIVLHESELNVPGGYHSHA